MGDLDRRGASPSRSRLALALLAVDVLRVPRDIAADDVRFQAAPRIRRDLWGDLGFLPGTPGVRLLGAGDDVASRKAIALFALIDPARVQIRTPEQEALRGRAQLEVTLRARDGGERAPAQQAPQPARRAHDGALQHVGA